MKDLIQENFTRITLYENKQKPVSKDAGVSACFQPPLQGLPVTSSDLSVTDSPGGLPTATSGPTTNAPDEDLQVTGSSLAVDPTSDVAFVVTTNSTAGVGGPAFDTFGFSTWSFIIENASPFVAPALVVLQLSPDNILWTKDSITYTVPNTNDIVTLMANRFMRYARVFYAAVNAASAITLVIFFQAQS